MWFQTLPEAISKNNIPEWLVWVPWMWDEVYTWIHEKWFYTTQAWCPSTTSSISIDKLPSWYKLRCINLLEWWFCAITWDWGDKYIACCVLWILKTAKEQEV